MNRFIKLSEIVARSRESSLKIQQRMDSFGAIPEHIEIMRRDRLEMKKVLKLQAIRDAITALTMILVSAGEPSSAISGFFRIWDKFSHGHFEFIQGFSTDRKLIM